MTDRLIDTLADGLTPVDPDRIARWLALGVLAGLAAAGVVFWLLPQIRLRPDLGAAVLQYEFWMKAAFAAAMAAIGYAALTRLSRPGRAPAWAVVLPALVWAGFALFAAGDLLLSPVESWADRLLGHSALRCIVFVAAISLPVLAALCLAVRRGAPTHLTRTGWAAGLTAGGIGALVYGLGCTEASPAFLAIWYALGVALVGLMGALAGRFALRW